MGLRGRGLELLVDERIINKRRPRTPRLYPQIMKNSAPLFSVHHVLVSHCPSSFGFTALGYVGSCHVLLD